MDTFLPIHKKLVNKERRNLLYSINLFLNINCNLIRPQFVREEATEMRMRASIATGTEAARAHDAEHARATERAYFTQRFEERKRELEKLEKRIFPPPGKKNRIYTTSAYCN